MDSAVQRIPVELWQEILEYTLASPLLPHPDDSILEARLVFAETCEADAIIRAHQRCITSCRLVSRVWNDIAQKLQGLSSAITCARLHADSDTEHPSHQKPWVLREDGTLEDWAAIYARIEVSPWIKPCSCDRNNCRFRQRIQGWAPVQQEVKSLRQMSAMAARVRSFLSHEVPRHVPYHAQALRAFSFFLPVASDKMRTLLQHSLYTHLTHLNCRTTILTFYEAFSGVSLPHLYFLRLDSPLQEHRSLKDDIEGPRFSKLKHLYIFGPIHSTERRKLISFVRSASTTLTSMIWESRDDQARILNAPFDFPTEFWDAMPHVTTFGFYPEIFFFARRELTIKGTPTPPPPKSDAYATGIHLLLPYSPKIWSLHCDWATRLGEIEYLVDRWKVNRVTLSEVTWEGLETYVRKFYEGGTRANLGCAPCFAGFFEVMKTRGIRVVDANGEASTEGCGANYVESLSRMGFDNVRWELSTWAD